MKMPSCIFKGEGGETQKMSQLIEPDENLVKDQVPGKDVNSRKK